MRIIWQRDFDSLLKKKLAEEERQQYEESFKIPLSSFEDMRSGSDIQLPLFLKAMGCLYFGDVLTFCDESLSICEQLMGGDISRYSKERTTQEYRSALQSLSRKYTKQRKCHLNLRAFVCYCDEHIH